ncbi:MAG: ATP-binding protein, partial [Saprospiraceae bacterium]
MRFLASISVAILLTGLCSFEAKGQDKILQQQHYGIENGLPHREVNAVCESRDGFIWVGTREGLCRFDGYEFVIYPASRHGFTSDNFQDIFEDQAGSLWLIPSTPIEDIDIWNPSTGAHSTFRKKFATVKDLPPVSDLNFSKTNEGVVFVFEPNGSRIWKHQPDAGLVPVTIPVGVNRIITVNQFIWCWDEASKLLYQLNQEGVTIKAEAFSDNLNLINFHTYLQFPLVLISKDPASAYNTTWVLDNEGPRQAPGLRLKFYFAFPAQDNGSKKYWYWYGDNIILDETGVVQYKIEKHSEMQGQDLGRGICFSNKNSLWIGGNFGLSKISFRSNYFRNFFNGLGAKNSGEYAVRGIARNDDFLFCQMEAKGLHRIDLKTGEIKLLFKKVSNNYYLGLTILQNGQIAVSHTTQVFVLDKEGKRLFESEDLVDRVWDIHERADGKLWLGTENGFLLYDLEKGVLFKSASDPRFQALNNAFVYHFRETKEGIYLCSTKGYFLIDPAKGILEHYWKGGEGRFHLPADIVYHAFMDEDASLWLGTNKGLFHLFPNGDGSASKPYYRQYDRADGLSNNVIYAVYPDNSGNLWLSSDYGIMRFDKRSGRVISFLEEDGACHNEFNRISHFQDDSGRIYFGSIAGISTFLPADIIEKEILPYQMVITAFEQFDGSKNKMVDRYLEVKQQGQITLQPSDRFFRIDYSLLSFNAPEKNYYAYKIEGVDREWNYLKDRSLRFGQLPYGKHLLRIRGQDASGNWSGNELSIPILVLKPFYLRSWFLLCLIFLAIAAIVGYVKYHTYALKTRNRVLEESVKARTATIEEQAEELRKLDQLKSRFFANVSHELRTPLTLMVAPLTSMLKREYWKDKDLMLLQMMQRNGKLLLKLVNEILDLSKLETGRIEVHETPVLLFEFMRPFVAQFSSFGDSVRVKFHYDYRADRDLVVLLDKEKVEKIINNFLSNALKFSPLGSTVDLMVEEQGQDLLVKVKDSGQGIHPKDLPYIFDRFFQSKQPDAVIQGGTGIGLSLCKELAELLSGKVWVESEYGAGSTFFFQFPMIKADRASLSQHGNSDDAEQAILPMPAILAKPTLTSTNPSILIVEDNADLRLFMQSFLGAHYQIYEAVNGKDGFDLLQSGLNPDLIISDVMMPVMDGIRMLELVKSKDQLRHIPFIILTARSDAKV